VQIEAKMMHVNKLRVTYTQNTPQLGLGRIHHFFPYNMLNVINKKDCIKMALILKSPKKE
jgi:hypothetical protein